MDSVCFANKRTYNSQDWRKVSSQSVFKTPYYLRAYIWIYPKSLIETLHNWNLMTTTFTETFDMDKDIKHKKCILKVTSKIKAQQINGLTLTLQTIAFFCLSLTFLLSLLNQTSVNRWFLLFIAPLKNYCSIVSFNKKLFRKAKRGHCHISLKQQALWQWAKR